jgi:hypothetical protein
LGIVTIFLFLEINEKVKHWVNDTKVDPIQSISRNPSKLLESISRNPSKAVDPISRNPSKPIDRNPSSPLSKSNSIELYKSIDIDQPSEFDIGNIELPTSEPQSSFHIISMNEYNLPKLQESLPNESISIMSIEEDDEEEDYKLDNPYKSLIEHAQNRLEELKLINSEIKKDLIPIDSKESIEEKKVIKKKVQMRSDIPEMENGNGKRKLNILQIQKIKLNQSYKSELFDEEILELITNSTNDIFNSKILEPILKEFNNSIEEYVTDLFNNEFI